MTPVKMDDWLTHQERTPLVMGVLNVTPDSFSDGGKFLAIEPALAAARNMLSGGADILDIGGESTRPGSGVVSASVQLDRVLPVIRALVADAPVTISIDTTSAEVAEASLRAGAHVVNDVSAGLNDPDLFSVVARHSAAVVLMHMQGTPQTMQNAPAYIDLIGEIKAFLRQRIASAIDAGVAPERILIDPGIGFGKTVAHNLEILRRLGEFRELNRPILLGTSRKGFIGAVNGVKHPQERGYGTAATIAWGLANGADVVRVHDVMEMRQVVDMTRAIQTGRY